MKNTFRNTRLVHGIAGFALIFLLALLSAPAASAADNWKDSFEEVCSKVDVSQTLSIKELEGLIERSDKLAPEIQKSDDPAKKVFLRRLKNCRSMFEFAIDAKKSEGK